MTKKTIKWRLAEKPSPENLLKLIEGGVLTKEEAKQIVLDDSEVSQSDIDTIKSELELLRKMVLEQGNSREIIKIIEKEIPIYVRKYPRYEPYWWNDYKIYCSNQGSNVMQLAANWSVNDTTIAKNLSDKIS